MLAIHIAARLAAASLTPPPVALPLPEVPSTLPFAPEAPATPAPVLPTALPLSAPAAPAADPQPATAGAPAETSVRTTVAADDPALTETRVPGEADPLAPLNRISYAISQPIDRFIIRPVAIVYKTVVPKPIRDGARNAIQNLSEPVVIINDMLQLRPDRAVKGVARFFVNTVFGIGGLFDIAKRKPIHIPHHENGFGDTLGYYGIGPLLYLYLPVLGPTTLRDTAGDYVNDLTQPHLLYKATHPNSHQPLWRVRAKEGKASTIVLVVDGIDDRAENDQELEAIRTDSVDPYASLRTSYLQDRAGEIASLKAKDGAEAANPHLDDPLADPAAGK